MEFSKINPKTATKNENSQKNDYNFQKQKKEALEQFEKLYLNLNNKKTSNKNLVKNELPPQKRNDIPQKIKVKFKKNTKINFADIFFKDQDKTLILILIVMLMDNEENITIIMILIFLLV